ncbi:glycosyltransferase [Indibacter alkaliphilus]|uniref:glycosyltransferase n=1 Tax=Indibacter alkaliphilus TaxID=579922 RepID=UPI00028237B9|nr:glycosyltransferase [Indibacter alkaliphilus]
MKILQIIDTLEMGGAERMAVNIANALSEDGLASFLVVSRKEGPLAKFLLPQVGFFCLGKRKSLDFAAFKKLIKLVKDIEPDVLHAHSTSIYWAVAVRLFFPKLKLVWHDHLGVNEEVIKENPRNELKILSKFFHGIITVNSEIRDWWIKTIDFSPKKIRYIKNFPFLNIEGEKVSNRIPIILHVANFRKEKGHLNLLKAVEILISQQFDFRLKLIGQIMDEELYQEIKKLIDSNGWAEKISILGPVEDIGKVLQSGDIGLVCSDREGLPVALLEYGLAGLKVISTDVGICAEVLGHGKFGSVVPANSPDQLALAIQHVSQEINSSEKKAMDFQYHVKEVYGSKQFLTAYFEFFREAGLGLEN